MSYDDETWHNGSRPEHLQMYVFMYFIWTFKELYPILRTDETS